MSDALSETLDEIGRVGADTANAGVDAAAGRGKFNLFWLALAAVAAYFAWKWWEKRQAQKALGAPPAQPIEELLRDEDE